MITRPDCQALMAGDLGNWLTDQQALRERTKATVRRRRRMGWISAAIVGVLVFIWTREFEPTAALAFVAYGAFYAWGEAAASPVRKSIKDKINGAVARSLGLNFTSEAIPGEEYVRAKTFPILPSFDKETFEDCWAGELAGCPFRTYEAHLQEWQGSGKDRKLVTKFRGALTTVAFNRRFHGTTMVERQRTRREGWIFRQDVEELKVGDTRLVRCDMVDPQFEDEFTVWGSDPVEARYLVHPEYIERLKAIETAFLGENIRTLFCGGDLLIVLETGDHYESGSLEASDDRTLLEQTVEQFASLADLAQQLNEAPRGNFAPSA